MFGFLLRRALPVASIVLLLGTLGAPSAQAQIYEQRDSSANPMVEVFKSTIYGGLAGLLLGSALALAMSNDNSGDTVKWSFVGGTFFGFGYGIYHVSTRAQPRAMLEGGSEGWALALPTVRVDRNDARMPASDLSPSVIGPTGLAHSDGVTVQATLARIGF